MKHVLVGLSGGVDSTVAAHLLKTQGWHVTGVTLLLWGGARQGSSCSTGDATAAQAAADAIGIDLHVIDWRDTFTRQVTDPYREAAQRGETDNPCIACNRVFKLDGLTRLADQWGIEHVATGHWARINQRGLLQRAVDTAKDQSYVLATAQRHHLARYLFPLGELTKDEVRLIARQQTLPAADTPDSMGLCLNRADLLDPIPIQLADTNGNHLGNIERGELLTIGQRRGINHGGGNTRRYIVDIDMARAVATVGSIGQLTVNQQPTRAWHAIADETPDRFQTSAHGNAHEGTRDETGIVWDTPQRTVAPGQLIVGYSGDSVVGYTYATRRTPHSRPATTT